MHLLELENYEVKPTEEFFMVKPLRDLYIKYYQKDWEKFMQYVSFIYHYADPRSTYAYIVDDDDRFDEIKIQEGLPKDFKITKELETCIEKYKLRVITTSYKLLRSTRVAVDKLADFLENIDLNERNDKGGAVYTISSVTQAIKQVPQLAKDLIDAERIISKEIEESGRAKGAGGEKSFFDDGLNF